MIIKKPGKIRQYWQKLMASTHRKMSEGAQELSRIIPWARKDCWRRNDKVQRGHEKHKK